MFANNNQFSFCLEFRFFKNISVRFHLRFYLYLLSFRPASYRRLPLCKYQNLTSRTLINLPHRAASTKATLPYLLLEIHAMPSSRFKLKSWKRTMHRRRTVAGENTFIIFFKILTVQPLIFHS